MSAFWKHYEAAKPHIAEAVDDIRHKVVEEGWFGRQVTGNIAETAEEVLKEEARHSLYEQTWGKAPAHGEIYGQGPAPAGTQPGIEPPKEPDVSQNQAHGPEL